MSGSLRLHEFFLRAAAKHPERIALETPSGESITYKALAQQSLSFAQALAQQHIGYGSRIALLAPKSIELVALMLGALRSGAAYVPLDPASPPERVRALLRDLDPQAFIAAQGLFPSEIPCQLEELSSVFSEKLGAAFFPGEKHEEDLAYILYTSGSTGLPKGACITHENAARFVEWGIETFRPQPGTRFSSIAPLHFDLSVFDIFVSLAAGGTTLLLNDSEVKNARLLAQVLSEKKINAAYATPSTWRAVSEFGKPGKYDFSSLKQILFAGEVFSCRHLLRLAEQLDQRKYYEGDPANAGFYPQQKRAYYNLYGPTETNVCTFYDLKQSGRWDVDGYFPIGRVCRGASSMIVDEQGDPAEKGELWIGGPQVFAGYWKRPEKNAEVFAEKNGERFYRTGDLVSVKNNCFFFHGRIDRMIKKRGYRIEPGEVEAVLLKHPDVLEAAVTSAKDKDGFDLLVAHVAGGGKTLEAEALRLHCASLLPPHMLPDRFLLLEELPKTASGKIDHKGLSESY